MAQLATRASVSGIAQQREKRVDVGDRHFPEGGVWEKITPKIAEKYLNMNVGNRALRSGVVEKYASDMRSGNWSRNPQPMIFYDDGTIADGQNRLWAVIESGEAIWFLVVRGVDK